MSVLLLQISKRKEKYERGNCNFGLYYNCYKIGINDNIIFLLILKNDLQTFILQKYYNFLTYHYWSIINTALESSINSWSSLYIAKKCGYLYLFQNLPTTLTRPDCRSISPKIADTNEDFPEPTVPTTAVNEPLLISTLISSKTVGSSSAHLKQ